MIGKTLSHYRVLEEIGRGGVGVVYRAIRCRVAFWKKTLPESAVSITSSFVTVGVIRPVEYSPEKTLINIGATMGGMGEAYPLIKSLGFVTAGIVSTEALANPEYISDAVDHICFIKDKQWGGKLPNSDELSPTSKAMVEASDILVAIGGNDIARDELLEGKALGKPIQYFPAEMDHEAAVRRAKYLGVPMPESFMGSVHDVFGK